MNHRRRLLTLSLAMSLTLSPWLCPLSGAESSSLVSIGPRVGFSGKSPLLGKEQKHFFHLTDIAAVFRLPWSSRFGHDFWLLETRVITSAGLLAAADDSGLLATIIPDLALSAWDGHVTIDTGAGAGFLTNYRYGTQNLGGPVQIAATAGIRVNPFSHVFAGFRVQHLSDAGIYGASSLGVDMYIVELGYRF